jgi:hypothetical protein
LRSRIGNISLLFVTAVASLSAGAVTYTYAGNTFTGFVGSPGVGPTNALDFSFTENSPLAPSGYFNSTPVSWSMSDGVHSLASVNGDSLFEFEIWTDVLGSIQSWKIAASTQNYPASGESMNTLNFPSLFGGRTEIDATTNFDVRGTPYAYTNNNPGIWGSSQPTCADIINNAVTVSASGPNMNAAFKPNYGLGLSQAASICGFTNFDWQQTINTLPDPSPYYTADGTHLTSSSTPFKDPPPGGYEYCLVEYHVPCNEYPLYYNPNTVTIPFSLGNHETTDTLSFSDNPSDPCLPGGNSQGFPGCNGLNAPAGSFQSYTTQLVGILSDGTPVPLPSSWSWTSTFNGTSGGTATEISELPVDPGSGTGGVVITSTTGTQLAPETSTLAMTTGFAVLLILFECGTVIGRKIGCRRSREVTISVQ